MDNTISTIYNSNPKGKTYTIDKGIPVPDKFSYQKGRWSPVLEAMEVGDSIAFPTRKESDQLLSAIRNAGFNNCVRKQDDGTYRVWKLGPRETK